MHGATSALMVPVDTGLTLFIGNNRFQNIKLMVDLWRRLGVAHNIRYRPIVVIAADEVHAEGRETEGFDVITYPELAQPPKTRIKDSIHCVANSNCR